ncbi:hypothetical protein L2E82_46962 [Cichorium intybus]|uniref:Uncharacterized protein n=1 Tax=Cichorium intybus TaxID=13427 RepID=A0ACB8YUI0_CICIN|nr:hypothetical protein L2E82_46962 [Cichorium intybus]
MTSQSTRLAGKTLKPLADHQGSIARAISCQSVQHGNNTKQHKTKRTTCDVLRMMVRQVLLLDWMKVPSVILVAENRHKKEGRSTDYFKVSET